MDPLHASAGAANPQTWNRYSYGLNNPLRYTDPSGTNANDIGTADDQRRNEQEQQQPPQQPQQQQPVGPVVDDSDLGKPPQMPKSLITSGVLTATAALANPICQALFKNGNGLSTLNQLAADKKILKQDVEVYDINTRKTFRLTERPDVEALFVDGTVYLNPESPVINGKLQGTFYEMYKLSHEEAIGAVLIHETAHRTGDFLPDGHGKGTLSLTYTAQVLAHCFPPKKQR